MVSCQEICSWIPTAVVRTSWWCWAKKNRPSHYLESLRPLSRLWNQNTCSQNWKKRDSSIGNVTVHKAKVPVHKIECGMEWGLTRWLILPFRLDPGQICGMSRGHWGAWHSLHGSRKHCASCRLKFVTSRMPHSWYCGIDRQNLSLFNSPSLLSLNFLSLSTSLSFYLFCLLRFSLFPSLSPTLFYVHSLSLSPTSQTAVPPSFLLPPSFPYFSKPTWSYYRPHSTQRPRHNRHISCHRAGSVEQT